MVDQENGNEKRHRFVACTGHGVYAGENGEGEDGEKWRGGHSREGAIYKEHVRYASAMSVANKSECLILSGGRTRTRDGKTVDGKEYDGIEYSEAEGMLRLGVQEGWFEKKEGWPVTSLPSAQQAGYHIFKGFRKDDEPLEIPIPVLLEKYARDSFENLLLSILVYRNSFLKMPDGRFGVVSFPWKGLRYSYAAAALGFEKFEFYGSGQCPVSDLVKAAKGETEFVAMASTDMDHRGRYFSEKRFARTPREDGKPSDKACDTESYAKYWADVMKVYAPGENDGEVREYLESLQAREYPPLPIVGFPRGLSRTSRRKV